MTQTDTLWANYVTSRDRASRDELILHYLNLVRYVASRVAQGLPQSVDQSDLVSYGTFGLIDAIERFDPERGFKFETFAITRIKGAILDELRGMDWVPRSVRSRARAIDGATQELEGKLRRAPTGDEMADALGMSESQYHTSVGQLFTSHIVGLDDPVPSSDSMTLGETLSHYRETAETLWEMQETLADAIQDMPLREKVVITLYYYEGLTLAEIGTVLGVTESRVCQIHTKAIENLQVELAKLAP